MKLLQWGLLATGRIARAFAEGVQRSRTGQLRAVGSRNADSASAFAREFKIPQAHSSYEALLADPSVDAIYISTPHPQHAEWIIKAAQAGKHILCEKPLTMNYQQALLAAEAARRHNVLLMEAFMVRCHPLMKAIANEVRLGSLGELRLIKATFSFNAGFDPASRLFNRELGGGGILDVGCYTTTLSRWLAGVALGLPYADPLKLSGSAAWLETGVDGWASALLEFPGRIQAQLSCGVQLDQINGVEIYGSTGWIQARDCWVPASKGGKTGFTLHRTGKSDQRIEQNTRDWLFSLEADAFARALHAGLRSVPEVPLDDSLGNMMTLDRWRAACGISDPSTQPSELPT
ncbi:MAG: Gfo/Idh/MocA family oxidoreductase [Blastochloris sp.]|nr:Gfo/Idh/MocA family oxidoreductase [Blastochloris sp.]